MNKTTPLPEYVQKLAVKIYDLTGYGGTLHPNDIIPELMEVHTTGKQEGVKEAIEAVYSTTYPRKEMTEGIEGYKKRRRGSEIMKRKCMDSLSELINEKK